MLKRVTITKVYNNPTNKDGVPYSYKKGTNMGKNFSRIGIQTDETGEATYYNNAMETDRAFKVEVGQTDVLRLEETPAADGSDKVFHNWSYATKKEIEAYNQFNPQ
jgi:hypothetical protein